MAHFQVEDLLDEDFDPALPRRGHTVNEGKLHRARQKRKSEHATVDEILSHADVGLPAQAAFNPTFSSSRYERVWILDYLGPFYDRQQISDVLRRVKGGKEANVYCCAGGPAVDLALVAAKVYRPRQFRNLRNDALYRQGREILSARGQPIRDRRALVAIRQGTRMGKEMQHTSWLAHEFQTLRILHGAGVHVPRPLVQADNTILMEYAGNGQAPAPALNEVRLDKRVAAGLYERLIEDVARMLACGKIHADLSAYNVLLLPGGDFRIIDFPQAIDPETHPAAYPIFRRDVTRLCQYFARYGLAHDPERLAADIWAEHGPRLGELEVELPEEHAND